MNKVAKPVGFPLSDWQAPPRPTREVLTGRYCRLEPLSPAHAEALHAANARNESGAMWTYLSYGPFPTLEAYRTWIEERSRSRDPLFYAVVDAQVDAQSAVGVASYLRIKPASGSLEVGHIAYSPLLQRQRAATEAMYLLMKRAFELGYRRYEWKCDALNAGSRRAAQRLGFSFEGVFRQATVYKGRNRDTAWYAVLDKDWPRLRKAFERWLEPDNFDANAQQRQRLSELVKAAVDPL